MPCIYLRLWEACRKNKVDTFQRYGKYIDLNRAYQNGITFLMQASHFGSMSIVLYLTRCYRTNNNAASSSALSDGAIPYVDINATSDDHTTALVYAITKGFQDIALFLISLGADVNIQTKVSQRSSLLSFVHSTHPNCFGSFLGSWDIMR